MATPRAKSDCFVSYRRLDKDFTQRLTNALTDAGKEVWVDWEDIPPASIDFRDEIVRGIEQTEVFIAILSPDYLSSPYCMMELNKAADLNKKLVPIVYRDVSPDEVPEAIAHVNWIFMNKPDLWDAGYRKTVSAIETDLAYVREHTRLLNRALEWDKHKRNPSYHLQGTDVTNARHWLKEHPGKEPVPSELMTQYVQSSFRAQQVQRQLLIGGIIITIIIGFLAILAYTRSIEASEQAEIANQERARAEVEADNAQALSLAGNAQAVLANGDTELATLLALQSNADGQNRAESERALALASYAPGTRAVLRGHEDVVAALDVTPDGLFAISASEDGSLRRWELATGAVVMSYDTHEDWISAIDIGSDGNYFVSGGRDEQVLYWNINQEEPVRAFEGHTSRVRGVALSPDGTRILSGGHDRQLIVWDVASGTIERTIEVGNWVQSVDFSPDGRFMLASDSGGIISVYDASNGDLLRQLIGHRDWVTRARFAPDGRTVISSGQDSTVRLWNSRSGAELDRFTDHTDYVFSVEFSADGRQAISASSDDTVIVWAVATGDALLRLIGHDGRVRDAQFAVETLPDGIHYRALSAGEDRTLRYWDLINGAEDRRFVDHAGAVQDVAFAPTGTYAATASDEDDNNLLIWDMTTDAILHRITSDDAINALDFSDDGRVLAAGTDANVIELYDPGSGERLAVFQEHISDVIDIDLNADGTRLLSGANDRDVILWDTSTGEVIHTLEGHSSIVQAVALSSDGTLALSGGRDQEVILWELIGGTELRRFTAHNDFINTVQFSPDGTRFISSGDDNIVILWEVTGDPSVDAEIRRFEGHIGPIFEAVFSPDAEHIVTGSSDGSVRVFDVASGLAVRRLDGHQAQVLAVARSDDEQFIMSSDAAGLVIRWDFHQAAVLESWARNNRFIRNFTPNECAIYRIEGGVCGDGN